MKNLFAKIKTNEDDAKEKIEREHEAMNLKAALAAFKKVEDQFPKAFSQVEVNISQLLMSKVTTATVEATKEEKNCLKEMQEIHDIIA